MEEKRESTVAMAVTLHCALLLRVRVCLCACDRLLSMHRCAVIVSSRTVSVKPQTN